MPVGGIFLYFLKFPGVENVVKSMFLAFLTLSKIAFFTEHGTFLEQRTDTKEKLLESMFYNVESFVFLYLKIFE